ncbi:hypothetical protein AB2B38_002885 [Balneola sp. MJW-20]|uniref:hypothetical protein n=1 Tax=Gracilimonas aurantiaca TaxID=3234185 RepID=UPI0034653178
MKKTKKVVHEGAFETIKTIISSLSLSEPSDQYSQSKLFIVCQSAAQNIQIAYMQYDAGLCSLEYIRKELILESDRISLIQEKHLETEKELITYHSVLMEKLSLLLQLVNDLTQQKAGS